MLEKSTRQICLLRYYVFTFLRKNRAELKAGSQSESKQMEGTRKVSCNVIYKTLVELSNDHLGEYYYSPERDCLT